MKVPKPALLDDLVAGLDIDSYLRVGINGRWYVARPTKLNSFKNFLTRAYHAWLVLVGRAHAFQYKEDQEDYK